VTRKDGDDAEGGSDIGSQFGRTLTLNLVDAVGSAIVRGEYAGRPFRPRRI
jgi:hypothetical protein